MQGFTSSSFLGCSSLDASYTDAISEASRFSLIPHSFDPRQPYLPTIQLLQHEWSCEFSDAKVSPTRQADATHEQTLHDARGVGARYRWKGKLPGCDWPGACDDSHLQTSLSRRVGRSLISRIPHLLVVVAPRHPLCDRDVTCEFCVT